MVGRKRRVKKTLNYWGRMLVERNLTLHDDGRQGDGTASDGRFGTRIQVNPGTMYDHRLVAADQGPGASQREARLSFLCLGNALGGIPTDEKRERMVWLVLALVKLLVIVGWVWWKRSRSSCETPGRASWCWQATSSVSIRSLLVWHLSHCHMSNRPTPDGRHEAILYGEKGVYNG